MNLNKPETIHLGHQLGVDTARLFHATKPMQTDELAAHATAALRRKGFNEAGVADPTRCQSVQ